MKQRSARALFLTLGGVVFIVLATANGAGYRYGVSDQAFYIPVVARALDPSLFPRDGSLIDAEGRLMVMDEILSAVVRTTGVSLEALFFIGYLLSMALLWIGVVLVGTRVYRHAWVVAALGAAVTFRHRIPRTSANSFEPYFIHACSRLPSAPSRSPRSSGGGRAPRSRWWRSAPSSTSPPVSGLPRWPVPHWRRATPGGVCRLASGLSRRPAC